LVLIIKVDSFVELQEQIKEEEKYKQYNNEYKQMKEQHLYYLKKELHKLLEA